MIEYVQRFPNQFDHGTLILTQGQKGAMLYRINSYQEMMLQFKTGILMQVSDLTQVLFHPTIKFGDWPRLSQRFFSRLQFYASHILKTLEASLRGAFLTKGRCAETFGASAIALKIFPPPVRLCKGCFCLLSCALQTSGIDQMEAGWGSLREHSYWGYHLLPWPEYNFIPILCKQ